MNEVDVNVCMTLMECLGPVSARKFVSHVVTNHPVTATDGKSAVPVPWWRDMTTRYFSAGTLACGGACLAGAAVQAGRGRKGGANLALRSWLAECGLSARVPDYTPYDEDSLRVDKLLCTDPEKLWALVDEGHLSAADISHVLESERAPDELKYLAAGLGYENYPEYTALWAKLAPFTYTTERRIF